MIWEKLVKIITFESESYHDQDLNNLFTNETETIILAKDDLDYELSQVMMKTPFKEI